MNLKKWFIAIILIFLAFVVIYSGAQKAVGYLNGVTTAIPDDLGSFFDYKAMLGNHLQRIRNEDYTFADMKQDQMEQLEFETRYAEVIYKLLKRLDEANLIGQ